MKKALTFLLAAILVLSLSVPAFAASIEAAGGSGSTTVKGTYLQGDQGGTVFSVNIEWSGMEFTYKSESKQIWDPDDLTYTGENSPAGWAASTGTITVRNSSNTFITAAPKYTADSDYTDAGMKFSSDTLYVSTAEPADGETTGKVQSGTISVTPTGTLPEDTDSAEIGTITVTIKELQGETLEDLKNLVGLLQTSITNKQNATAAATPVSTDEEVAALDAGTSYYWNNEKYQEFSKLYIEFHKMQTLVNDDATAYTPELAKEVKEFTVYAMTLIDSVEILTK